MDSLRGLFIVILTIDHMSGFLVKATWQTFGYVSVLPGFLFISGYLLARVYGRSMLTRGVATGMGKLFRRMSQVYVWHLVSVALVFGGSMMLMTASVDGLGRSVTSIKTMMSVALLQEMVYYFDVIPLYLFLMALTAGLLLLFRHAPFVIALIALALWLMADLIPVALRPWGESAYLQPLRWQVVFLLGVAIGLFHLKGQVLTIPRWLLAGAATLALALFLVRWHIVTPPVAWWDEDVLFARNTLEAGRLLNILCLGVVGVAVLPRLRPWLARSGPLILLGQNSLIAFSLQIAIVHYVTMIRDRSGLSYLVSLRDDGLTAGFDWSAMITGLSFDVLAVGLVVLCTALVVQGRLIRLRAVPSERPLS